MGKVCGIVQEFSYARYAFAHERGVRAYRNPPNTLATKYITLLQDITSKTLTLEMWYNYECNICF